MYAKKASKSIDGDVITFAFTVGGELIADLSKVPQDTIHKLAMHGFSQKLGDSYAGSASDSDEAFIRASAVLKDLYEGNWSTRVASGSPRTTQLAEALAAATNESIEDVIAKLDKMDDDGKKALRKHPQIQSELAKIKAKKAQEDAARASEDASGVEAIQF